jgi:hypothetical protein
MRTTRRGGFTLVELMIGVVISAFVGLALVRLISSQSRFYERQTALRNARSVSRSALNLLQSELRMVEAEGGVVEASATRIVVRIPYAMGVVCGDNGGRTVVGLLPVDSLVYATAAFSGYAWRDSVGEFHYVEGVASINNGAPPGPCTSENITMPAGSDLIALSPALPPEAKPGSAVLLEQQIAYEFRTSTEVPGAIALWRTPVASGAGEELAAPFETTARFRFYRLDERTPTSTVPADLGEIRGLDLWLHAKSERNVAGRAPEVSRYKTGIFFKNRMS